MKKLRISIKEFIIFYSISNFYKAKLSVYLTHKQFNNRFTQHFSPKVKVLFFYHKRRNEMSYKISNRREAFGGTVHRKGDWC